MEDSPAKQREMNDEEIRRVFERLDLPVTPPTSPPSEPEPFILFPITGDSPPITPT
jgi:hypothetical protein